MELLVVFAVPVALVLALDLGVFQRTPRDPTFREALAWTAIWVALAAVFGLALTARLGPARGAEYAAAYLVEQALSVDNLLVLIVIFGQLAIPRAAQRKVLAAGVLGAFAFRIALVAGGAELANRFSAVGYVLGGVLVAMAYKLMRGGDDEAKSPPGIARWLRRLIPVSRELDGTRLVTREAGRLRATPILLAIIVVELTDIVFAIDSIPAVLGVTTHPVVAVTSNLFAVLGLRSLYFVIAGLLGRLRHLEAGLALVLAFVGLKMLVAFAIEVPVAVELAVIASILGGAIALSLRAPQPRSDS
jgi:TerC family integral membrane protein